MNMEHGLPGVGTGVEDDSVAIAEALGLGDLRCCCKEVACQSRIGCHDLGRCIEQRLVVRMACFGIEIG